METWLKCVGADSTNKTKQKMWSVLRYAQVYKMAARAQNNFVRKYYNQHKQILRGWSCIPPSATEYCYIRKIRKHEILNWAYKGMKVKE